MGDAVIYAWREEQGDVWTGEWALDRKDKWVPAEANKYILATPEALAASPEVAKLIREAEARGMERAALRVRAWHDEAVHPTHYVSMLLRDAAIIRKGGTL